MRTCVHALYLLALRKSSCDMLGTLSSDPIVCKIERRQRPDGRNDIRGRTGDGLGILVLACTQE